MVGLDAPVADDEGVRAVLDARDVSGARGPLQERDLPGADAGGAGEGRIRQLPLKPTGQLPHALVTAVDTIADQHNDVRPIVVCQSFSTVPWWPSPGRLRTLPPGRAWRLHCS